VPHGPWRKILAGGIAPAIIGGEPESFDVLRGANDAQRESSNPLSETQKKVEEPPYRNSVPFGAFSLMFFAFAEDMSYESQKAVQED
jgi:hypothetical protein